MRTTLQIDDDVLNAAKTIARLEGKSLGAVVSQLARKGLKPSPTRNAPDGFPVFSVESGAPTITEETVKAALEDGG